MNLELITPTRLVLSTPVTAVTVPGSDGIFGVLPGHMPLVATLCENGVLEATGTDGTLHRMVISAGFVDVKPDSVTVLAEDVTEATA